MWSSAGTVASKRHRCRQSSAVETESEKQAAGTTPHTEAELLQTRLSKCLCLMAKRNPFGSWMVDPNTVVSQNRPFRLLKDSPKTCKARGKRSDQGSHFCPFHPYLMQRRYLVGGRVKMCGCEGKMKEEDFLCFFLDCHIINSDKGDGEEEIKAALWHQLWGGGLRGVENRHVVQ